MAEKPGTVKNPAEKTARRREGELGTEGAAGTNYEFAADVTAPGTRVDTNVKTGYEANREKTQKK
ncbi:hypothetical protein [Neomoorella thermoacetica]|uniref:Uncharacterized protein n=2 Tax=Neomoorella thermoacetica TaxID=1525 RepID=A0A1D7X8K3_NEOTH|nr:hypothetical protein [Moorella thermoacetica]AKX93330.1 hypothetical protein MOTHE_c05240 [Moorella thermoacetica]AKX95973.1 hypothetical protein MOTHA_c06140 [Moorella thermoacetica]AOQ23240.1 hypothetical protein Maut_00778 [Moorella thermoacetica]APC07696.1 hypothetical protein MTJW_05240 [Moorella thermoacetica]OIQ08566.1 hypothetical protein MOOR_17130 [Moorella thermoacetica]